MKRELYIWTLVFLGILHSYLIGDVLPAIFAFTLFLYMYYSKVTFNPNVTVRINNNLVSTEEGKEIEIPVLFMGRGIINAEFKGDYITSEKVRLRVEGQRNAKIKVKPIKKGIYDLRLKVKIEDFLGLQIQEKIFPGVRIEVVPSVDSIREAAKEEYRLRLKERYKKGIVGTESLDFHGLREYIPGDDIKKIDWKASARLKKLIIREFLKEKDSEVYIVLDQSREMRKGKIDYASALALYIATMLIRNGYYVGLIKYWEGGYKRIPPGRGEGHLNKIRMEIKYKRERGILSLRAEIGKVSTRALNFLRKSFRKKKGIWEALLEIKTPSYIVIISDLTSQTSRLYALLSMIRKKHRIIILSPNPVLFYQGDLNEETLRKLYKRMKEREKIIRKFNSLAPTIDLGPSDYGKEVLRVIE
ncbi:DUF58 domain-containing protein [Pyrococcus kukulkanii]|uniref:DUF58 domain-containing protein n=1 Tax=Pyrococcus kukulkanii TaxID=1609559 RepID=UPI003566340D